jgi:hypothetical protein
MLPSFLIGNKSENLTPRCFKQVLKKPESEEEMVKFVYASRPPISKLLSLGKFELKQDDLKSVLSGNITTVTIDALLTIIKHLNTTEGKKNESHRKVMIAKTKFTEKMFTSDQFQSSHGSSECTMMIFPVFVGYWTFLTFDISVMVVSYYDSLNTCCYLKEILKNFSRYLQKVFKKIELKSEKNIKDIVYQKIYSNDGFTEEDSAVHMIYTIWMLSSSRDVTLARSEVPRYRVELLKLLFSFGRL